MAVGWKVSCDERSRIISANPRNTIAKAFPGSAPKGASKFFLITLLLIFSPSGALSIITKH